MNKDFLMPIFHRLPISFEYGRGVWLFDSNGDKYLDAAGGLAVNILGHGHPKLAQTISEQASKLIHVSNAYTIKQQEKLAEMLCDLSGMDQVFFCNSGAESNETAIKITRMHARDKNIQTPIIAVANNAFHGRTMATLTASHTRIRKGFEPLLQDFIRIPFNDVNALEFLSSTDNSSDIVAIMLEPIQGESGVTPATYEYLSAVKKLCNEKNWLFILDEIQTGIGRTGKYFNYQHYPDILPDIMTLAKGLAGGMPIGACLSRGIGSNKLKPGQHGSTFGGNPLACASGITVLNTIKEEKILENVEEQGKYLFDLLNIELKNNSKIIKEIRGQGLMVGIELKVDNALALREKALKYKLLINVTANNVIRLLPPLIINKSEIEIIVDGLKTLLNETYG